jgi:hypothetical protein
VLASDAEGGVAEEPPCLGIKDYSSARKRPLEPKHVWSIRARLEISRSWRDLRARDLVKLRFEDGECVRQKCGSRVTCSFVETKGPELGFPVFRLDQASPAS